MLDSFMQGLAIALIIISLFVVWLFCYLGGG